MRKRKQVGFGGAPGRSEEHTSELQSLTNLVCRLLLEKKKTRPKGKALPSEPSTTAAPGPRTRKVKALVPARSTAPPPRSSRSAHPHPLPLSTSHPTLTTPSYHDHVTLDTPLAPCYNSLLPPVTRCPLILPSLITSPPLLCSLLFPAPPSSSWSFFFFFK